MTGEEVLVIARDRVPEAAGWYGLRTDGMTAFLGEVAAHARFAPRAQMEVDPSWKQLIPYLVLRDGDRYFLMRRTRAGGDARLHDRWSIGVGGHHRRPEQQPLGAPGAALDSVLARIIFACSIARAGRSS